MDIILLFLAKQQDKYIITLVHITYPLLVTFIIFNFTKCMTSCTLVQCLQACNFRGCIVVSYFKEIKYTIFLVKMISLSF